MSEHSELSKETNAACTPGASKRAVSRQFLETTGNNTINEFLNVTDKRKGK